METRNIKELLEVMLNTPELFTTGMCAWNNALFFGGRITATEWSKLRNYLYNNSPNSLLQGRTYWWDSGLIEPRIEWLKNNIILNT